MTADRDSKLESGLTIEKTAPGRRRLLSSIGWGLLATAALSLSGCGSPQFDSDRGVLVLRPKK
jgi:hypothetical protein